MIYSLTVTNSIGESLTFELSNPLASGYAIKTIDGLGTPDMNVNTTPYGIGDGSVLGSIKAEYRLITIILYPLAKPSVETMRQQLYRYFQIKKDIILSFVTENRRVLIDGYVQNIEPSIFENPESISIEIKCVNPYFYRMMDDQTKFYGAQPLFQFPFSCEIALGTGIGWSKDTFSGVIYWSDFIYGDGKFVGVGYDEIAPVAFSLDGLSWTKTELLISPNSNWSGIAYGNGRFVTIFYDSNIGSSSTDGENWELISLPLNAKWSYVCYGEDRFVAISDEGSSGAYSYDGLEWFEIDLPMDLTRTKLIYGNGYFVIFKVDSNIGFYSQDGIVWKEINFPIEGPWHDAAYGNGNFIFTRTRTGRWLIGPDLDSLASTFQPGSESPFEIGYGDGIFIAVQKMKEDAFYSLDGLNWTSTKMPSLRDWIAIGGANGKSIVLSSDGYLTTTVEPYDYIDPIEFSRFTEDNRMEIDYQGEVDTGIRITIECQSLPGDIIIYNVDTLERMEIFSDRIEAITGAPLGPKDVVEINTEGGNKYVRLLRNGEYKNILGAMNRGMSWFILHQGKNIFTYTTEDEHAGVLMTFSYKNAYVAI